MADLILRGEKLSPRWPKEKRDDVNKETGEKTEEEAPADEDKEKGGAS